MAPYTFLTIQQLTMNDQQNTLLGFLQRQSLFNHTSPNLRTRSRYHRSKDILQPNDKHYLTQQSRFTSSQESSPANYRDNRHVNTVTSSRYSKEQRHYPPHNNDRNLDSPQRNLFSSQEKIKQSSRRQPYEQTSYRSPPQRMGVRAQAYQPQGERVAVKSQMPISMRDGFQTAHIESFQCLQSISNKLWVRIIDINHKLENFQKMVRTWISQELLQAQQSIINIVQIAFKEQEALIQAYVAKQEADYAAQLAKTKEMLQKQYKRIDQLEGHLRGQDWRKAAGEILSSDLQRKMEHFIQQTTKAGIPEWKPKSFVRDHLRIIELQVRQIFKLKTFP